MGLSEEGPDWKLALELRARAGRQLEQFCRSRGFPRLEGETDEDLRWRVYDITTAKDGMRELIEAIDAVVEE